MSARLKPQGAWRVPLLVLDSCHVVRVIAVDFALNACAEEIYLSARSADG